VVEADVARLPPAEWPGLTLRATITDGTVRYETGLG
jgi:hypothetical protein